jgi:CubicO group peptidase (beta-lactamase class C family)
VFDPDLLQALRQLPREPTVPGIAVAVAAGAASPRIAVDGVREHDKPARLEVGDRFHIASCTKSMTAMLAAALVEQRRLSWTTTLGEGLPAPGAIRAEYRTVTLEQLLAHSGRLPAYTSPTPERIAELRALPGSPTEQRLAFVSGVLRDEPPLEAGSDPYSNAGYAAAASMIEHAAGEPWETLVRARIAEPLGMTSFAFGWPATPASPDQPRGHATEDGAVQVMPLDHPFLVPCLWPAGAVSCSIGDLVRYVRDHLHGLTGRRALLSATSYLRLHRTLAGKPGFTLGWGVMPTDASGPVHFGAGSGGWYFARLMIAPQRDTAAVAISNSGDAGALTRALCQDLLARYGRARS